MLVRLAFGNIRRTLRDYAIYAVTLVLGVAVFYAFNTITVQADFLEGDVSDMFVGVRDLMETITVALALVMGFLMVYANNYLMRRRSKELGLYQVLGMRPGQVNAVLVLETLSVGALSLAVGLGAGMLLSQLMVFLTAALFRSNVSHFHFFVSPEALALTLGCFVLMFLVMMVFNVRTLRHVRLVDLMGRGRRNEGGHARGLAVSVPLFLLGLALVVVAYVRLTRQGIPGFGTDSSSGRPDFYLTTLLVTVGTVLLFFGLSGVATGLLSHLRRFYWRGLRMFTVRQVAARVNTASVSMAVIAMLLFLAMASVTSGMVVVNMVNQQVEGETSFDASVVGVGFPQDSTQAPDLAQGMRSVDIDPSELGIYAQVNLRFPIAWSSDPDASVRTFADVQEAGGFTLADIAHAVGEEPTGTLAEYADMQVPFVVSLTDYNAVRALCGRDAVQVASGRYLMLRGDDAGANHILDKALQRGYAFDVAGETLVPAQDSLITDASALVDGANGLLCVLVVPDDVAAKCTVYMPVLDINYGPGADVQAADALMRGDRVDSLLEDELGFSVLIHTATGIVQDSVSTRGLITYLAIYIGFVLVVACAAILAIQQLSAASDAVTSYRTLAELGCPEGLVFGSLRAQATVSFVLPLVVGIAHSACALNVVDRSLGQLGLVGAARSSALATAIFVLVYGGYLAITYHTAKGIVRSGLRSARHEL